MEWHVYYDNVNKKQITYFNIFDHCGFRDDFCKIAAASQTKEEFAEAVRQSLMYHFWSRAEYEVLVYSWPVTHLSDPCIKVDIYSQIKMNWQAFVDYTWSHRHEVRDMKAEFT